MNSTHHQTKSILFPNGVPPQSKFAEKPINSSKKVFKASSESALEPAWFFQFQNSQQKNLRDDIDLAANSKLDTLIIGETGSGKELVARTLYKQHLKRNYLSIEDAPFIAINCGAIPENLAESILFGHERGAFTSARERQYGRFEQAKRGILFLDEIQALAPSTQVKLLRAIQERKIDRLGSKSSSEINCRVIAATNIPLEILVEEGQFRTDLYYRLNICPIYLPPLRKRGADFSNITLGVQKYLNEKLNIPLREISRQCFEALEQYNWPGNIRELEHCLLYASIRTSNTIELTHLPPSLRKDCAHYLKDGNWDIVMQKKIHQQ